jgi:hypothetical protein
MTLRIFEGLHYSIAIQFVICAQKRRKNDANDLAAPRRKGHLAVIIRGVMAPGGHRESLD